MILVLADFPRCLESCAEVPFAVAVTFTENVPDAVVVSEIVPVDAFIVRPVGSPVSDQVTPEDTFAVMTAL